MYRNVVRFAVIRCSLTSQAAHDLLRVTDREESAIVIGQFHHV
jgi:hypothetical protein